MLIEGQWITAWLDEEAVRAFLRLRPGQTETGSPMRASVVTGRIVHESPGGLWLEVSGVRLPDGQTLSPGNQPVYFLSWGLLRTARLSPAEPTLDEPADFRRSRGADPRVTALQQIGCPTDVAEPLARLIREVQTSHASQQLPVSGWRSLSPPLQAKVTAWLAGQGFALVTSELAGDLVLRRVFRAHEGSRPGPPTPGSMGTQAVGPAQEDRPTPIPPE
jgi:hypothetical protein